MQTHLESLGVPASFIIPHNAPMPEAPQHNGHGWVHPQQGFPPMEQINSPMNQQSNHIFVMNNVKPEQSIPRREEVLTSPPPPSPQASPSVITATYNPTYNRCLPKILSDLDCEMKIKQVLRCIENILLENGDVDLHQQAYKLPDRSSSPQFAKTKKPKFKEDEEMMQAPSPHINLPLATNSPASLINKAAASKNPIKINVKVEPEDVKSPGLQQSVPPTTSPRAQMFDFSYKPQQTPPQNPLPGFPPQSPMQPHPPRVMPFENFPNSPHHAQPMIPHIQLSMSSPHLNNSGPANSPHLHHLQTSSPHIVHSPLHNVTNSPHLVHSPLSHSHSHSHSPHPHSPLPHSPLGQSQAPSPHLPPSNGVLASQNHISPLTQYQVITNPHPQQEQHPEPHPHGSSDTLLAQDYHYPQVYHHEQQTQQQAGGFKPSENAHPVPQPQAPAPSQKKEGTGIQDFVLDPALFAQYLAQNQQQLQQLQQQLQQQQLQHNQLQQQRQQMQQNQNQTNQTNQNQTQTQTPAQNNPPQPVTGTPIHALPHLFNVGDPAHPISLPLAALTAHPMSFSGHLLQQIGPDGIQEDDKWILSLLNNDSSIAHDLSLSGQIPPL